MAHKRPSPFEGVSDGQLTQGTLKKGRACINCRRRKMKCDGVQPICGSCLRTDKAEDCEYITGSERSTTQKLEEEIQRLQTRLRDLQTPIEPHQGVILQQPYGPEPHSRRPSSDFQEPPRHIAQRLLDTFLAHASQHGFFLHPGRFRHSVQSPGPVGHESRPSPSLLSTMYLFGIHLSQDPEMKRHERTYFDLSIQLVSQDTSSTATHPKHRLHIIQAEVLLAYYFFSNKRPMEGKYHSYAAFSLAIASGIHRMRVRNPPESTLSPATDDIEEGERVNAYWAVFCLDKEWSAVFNCNPNITCPSPAGTRILTPLPREIEEYETGRYQCERRHGHTFDDFINGTETPDESLTSRALHAKAACLFERARTFSRMTGVELSGMQRNDFGESFRHYRHLALNLKSTLPPFETWLRNPNIGIVRTAFVGVTLLDAALIRLHSVAAAQGDDRAHQQAILCAQEIFSNSMRLAAASWNFGFLNPVIGFAWREAFNVLYDDLNTRNTNQLSWPARHSSVGGNLPATFCGTCELTSRALHAKAACLFERARTFSRMTGVELSGMQRNDFGESFRHYRHLALNLKSTLPPFETWLRNPNIGIVRTAFVGVTLLDAALIRLHSIAAAQGDDRAHQQAILCAQEIFSNSIRLAAASWNFGSLNPVIGFAWREAFNVLYDDLNTRNTNQLPWPARHSSPQSEDPLRRQLRKGVSSFSIYASSSSFISGEVEEMTNILQGVPYLNF
ncbi:hypothetical protein AN958_03423 [Leucoagaricus sp. SymC.cos]|nr:hypothetical protein AN958_03423 [Leucoagaricus sp. SymC.cos]